MLLDTQTSEIVGAYGRCDDGTGRNDKTVNRRMATRNSRVYKELALGMYRGAPRGVVLGVAASAAAVVIAAALRRRKAVQEEPKVHEEPCNVEEEKPSDLPAEPIPVIFRMPQGLAPSVSPRHGELGLGTHDNSNAKLNKGRIITFSYAADAKAAAEILSVLPPGVTLAPGALNLKYTFSYMECLDWMGGVGHNLCNIEIPVVYAGRQYNYSLVMWEDHVDPIVSGREELGQQKLHAELPDPVENPDGTLSCKLVRHGKTLIEFTFDPSALLTVSQEGVEKMNDSGTKAVSNLACRSLPLYSATTLVESAPESGVKLFSLSTGTTAHRVRMTPPSKADELTQCELLELVTRCTSSRNPKDELAVTDARTYGTAESMTHAVLAEVPKIPGPLGDLGNNSRIGSLLPTKLVGCQVVEIPCACDREALAKRFPQASHAKSSNLTLTVISYELWGRRQRTLRLTVPTASGELVVAQWESDPEKVYISREEIGAPSTPACIELSADGSAISAAWDGNNAGKSLKRYSPHVFLEVKLGDSSPPTKGAGGGAAALDKAGYAEKTLLHHYVMPRIGEWGRNEDDRMLTFSERRINIKRVRERSVASVLFKPGTKNQCALYYMVFNSLVDLKVRTRSLLAAGGAAVTYDADIQLVKMAAN